MIFVIAQLLLKWFLLDFLGDRGFWAKKEFGGAAKRNLVL